MLRFNLLNILVFVLRFLAWTRGIKSFHLPTSWTIYKPETMEDTRTESERERERENFGHYYKWRILSYVYRVIVFLVKIEKHLNLVRLKYLSFFFILRYNLSKFRPWKLHKHRISANIDIMQKKISVKNNSNKWINKCQILQVKGSYGIVTKSK